MGGYHSACCHNGGAFEIFTQNVCMAIMLGIIMEMLTIGSPALLLQKKVSYTACQRAWQTPSHNSLKQEGRGSRYSAGVEGNPTSYQQKYPLVCLPFLIRACSHHGREGSEPDLTG